MNSYFEAYWREWLVELRIPAADATNSAAEKHFHETLKSQQLSALQACLAFHIPSFPSGTRLEDVCNQLNQGVFYSLAKTNRDSPRMPRQAAGSLFKDVLLAQGCWIAENPNWGHSQIYRDRFFETYFSDWSEWILGKPNGLDYLQQRGERYFSRFCGSQPVVKRPWPYVIDYRGEWDLRTHLAMLTQGDYTDFLAKSPLARPLGEAGISHDQSASFENDECCQKAARKLFSTIGDEAFGTLTDAELSLLYFYLLGDAEPYQTLADLTAQPSDQMFEEYDRLTKRILAELRDDIVSHKFRCPCFRHFREPANHQSRGRCRCLAYSQYKAWYHATHERLFRGQNQQMLIKFAHDCDKLLNRQSSWSG